MPGKIKPPAVRRESTANNLTIKNTTETLNKIRAANPAIEIRSVSFYNDNTIAATVVGSNIFLCEDSVEKLCAELADVKVKTPEEKKAEEIAALKSKLAALESEGK